MYLDPEYMTDIRLDAARLPPQGPPTNRPALRALSAFVLLMAALITIATGMDVVSRQLNRKHSFSRFTSHCTVPVIIPWKGPCEHMYVCVCI